MQKTTLVAFIVTGVLLSSTGALAYYQSPAVREAREARKVSREQVEKDEEVEVEEARASVVVVQETVSSPVVSNNTSPSQDLQVTLGGQEVVSAKEGEEVDEEDEKENERDDSYDEREDEDEDSVPATQPTQTPTTTSSGYTLATVAQHATSSNCWSVVGGNVYDLTSWVSRHPGGSSSIVGMCGIDATSRFEGKHGGSSSAKAALVLLKIGALAN